MMGRPESFTVEEVMAALEKSGGIRSGAAMALGCSPSTITAYIERYSLHTFLEEIEDNKLDIAESQLLKQIGEGALPAIFFYLKCKGKRRGWVERQELTGPGGKDLVPSEVVTYRLPENGRG